MDTNIYVVLSLILRSFAVLLPIIYVLPKQIAEIRRPNYGFNKLRVGLFWLVVLWIVFIAASMPYMYTRIDQPSGFNLRELTTVVISILALIKSLLWVFVYTSFSKGKGKV